MRASPMARRWASGCELIKPFPQRAVLDREKPRAVVVAGDALGLERDFDESAKRQPRVDLLGSRQPLNQSRDAGRVARQSVGERPVASRLRVPVRAGRRLWARLVAQESRNARCDRRVIEFAEITNCRVTNSLAKQLAESEIAVALPGLHK
jgi:hypothetical protein